MSQFLLRLAAPLQGRPLQGIEAAEPTQPPLSRGEVEHLFAKELGLDARS